MNRLSERSEATFLLVSRNFPPLQGGMEKLNQHLLEELSKSYRTALVGPVGSSEYALHADTIKECRSALIPFLVGATLKAVLWARVNKPSVIMAGSGVNGISAWLAAKISGARWGVYLHGLDIIVNSALYRWVFLRALRKADFWIVNSRATRDAAIETGFDASRIYLLNPGVAVSERLPSKELVKQWLVDNQLQGKKVLLSVGRLMKRKGLAEFISRSLPDIVKACPDVVLVVIGEAPKSALLKTGTCQAELIEMAQMAGVDSNVRLMGSVSDDSLQLAYAAADVHVFPVLDLPGDMEGFGMVSIEAASAGTPTVAFSAGGVPDAVRCGISGQLIPPGDYLNFAETVVGILKKKVTYDLEELLQFSRQFSWSSFGASLRDIAPLRREDESKP
ncbi:glycosyltransferase [Marinobacter sp. NP-4(2019)]|uniref:glycosyltransferase family 4 protein n=1 Tax=Marinobacter sp. NP-4(2019) TaxID=2488665 RepID=UPI000FC3E3C8|nr:glycosyltransferase family 4 protein [Marinobacter sp. NP-4(2019)]AZT84549.1 glycosyltransferase [Marinobacter sp. NP-4(2019)]